MLSACTAPDRQDFLDVARGAAALLVLVEHGLHTCVPGYLERSRANVVIGYAAIVVFFMVSGFVIPQSLQSGRSNASFWLRRAFRLFPVYWLSIALAFAYLCAGGTGGVGVPLSDPAAWLANLTLLQGCLKCPHVWGVFWTLPFELLIYAVCSLLFACRLLNRIGGRVFLALAVLFLLVGVGRPLLAGKPMGIGGLRMVVLSSLLGLLARRYASGQLGRGAFYGLLSGLAAAVLIVWAVNHALFPSAVGPGELSRFVCIWGLALAFFVGLLEARRWRMPAVACWLGRRSYPIYLLHPFALLLLTPTGWPVWAFMPSLVVFTLLLSALAHRLVELPGIALGRLIERRLRAATPPAPVLARRAA